MPRERSGERVPSIDTQALQRARAAVPMTLDALGEAVAIPRPALIGYEKGRIRPGIEILVALARVLGVEPLELMGVTRADATLAHLRAAAGLTKTALAAQLGMARSMWALVENGTRTLQPGVAARLAELLEVHEDDVRAAHRRGVAAGRSGAAAVTEARHFALVHHLPADLAATPATEDWVRHRAREFAVTAGVAVHAVTVDAAEYHALTGVAVGPNDWGSSSWAGGHHVVFVDPTCGPGTKAGVELVIAHEISHLRWRSYGHRRVFFTRVQQLLDQVPVPAAAAHVEARR